MLIVINKFDIDEASADIIARLKVEVEKTLTKINARKIKS